jgi:hypothetical protein
MDNNWIFFAAIAVILWITVIILKRRREKRRLLAKYSELMSKYNDRQIVAAIMEGNIWQGMSQEQLVDSRGLPDREEEVSPKQLIAPTSSSRPSGSNGSRSGGWWPAPF